jgi:hypothetical protein
MNQSKQLRLKPKKIELQVNAVYRIDGQLYEIIDRTPIATYGVKLDEQGEAYGKTIMLGGLMKKVIEKVQ